MRIWVVCQAVPATLFRGSLKLLKTCSLLLVVISLLETEISHERRIMFDGDRLRKQVQP